MCVFHCCRNHVPMDISFQLPPFQLHRILSLISTIVEMYPTMQQQGNNTFNSGCCMFLTKEAKIDPPIHELNLFSTVEAF